MDPAPGVPDRVHLLDRAVGRSTKESDQDADFFWKTTSERRGLKPQPGLNVKFAVDPCAPPLRLPFKQGGGKLAASDWATVL